jgi:hypothetical protein
MADGASSRETKFGYGFLFAGAGLPYLVDKLLGPIAALVVAALCLLIGIGFLVAGHLDNKGSRHQRGVMETIGMFTLIGASSGALIGSISGAIWIMAHKTQNGSSQNSETTALAPALTSSPPRPVTAEPVAVKPVETVPPPKHPPKVRSNSSAKNNFLLFKASPLFTVDRKMRIVRDITRFRAYLAKLDLYLPVGLLPVGVDDPNTAFGTNIVIGSQDVTLSDYVFLKPESIDDPPSVTRAYGSYVIMKTLRGPASRTLPDWATNTAFSKGMARITMQGVFVSYLNWSFWGKKTEDDQGRDPWLASLWDLREHFEPQFSDSLVSYLIKSFASSASPKSIGGKAFMAGQSISLPNPLMDAVVHSHLFRANRIVDNNDSRLSAINAILSGHGITVPQ